MAHEITGILSNERQYHEIFDKNGESEKKIIVYTYIGISHMLGWEQECFEDFHTLSSFWSWSLKTIGYKIAGILGNKRR